MYYDAIDCPSMNMSYCCGDCGTKRCCNITSERLNQTKCTDVCSFHYQNLYNYIPTVKCNLSEPFCCGSCNNRKCCSSSDLILDQQGCIETCYSYYDMLGLLYPEKKCTEYSPYCCGTCTNRLVLK